MGIFVCNICKKECDRINALRSHSIQKHNISGDKIYIDYILKGITPKCECGCGGTPPFVSIGKGFSRFIKRSVKPIHRFLAWMGCKRLL